MRNWFLIQVIGYEENEWQELFTFTELVNHKRNELERKKIVIGFDSVWVGTISFLSSFLSTWVQVYFSISKLAISLILFSISLFFSFLSSVQFSLTNDEVQELNEMSEETVLGQTFECLVLPFMMTGVSRKYLQYKQIKTLIWLLAIKTELFVLCLGSQSMTEREKKWKKEEREREQ